MRLAVVGDTLLDVELMGHAERLCPDAPAPILDVERRTECAGGAGLVATLLADDGHDVTLVTALSDDDGAAGLRSLLCPIRVVAGEIGGPTPTKTRLSAGGHTIARVDEGCGSPSFPFLDPKQLSVLKAVDAVVVADYGRKLACVPLGVSRGGRRGWPLR